jgi:hypothetical protein
VPKLTVFSDDCPVRQTGNNVWLLLTAYPFFAIAQLQAAADASRSRIFRVVFTSRRFSLEQGEDTGRDAEYSCWF